MQKGYRKSLAQRILGNLIELTKRVAPNPTRIAFNITNNLTSNSQTGAQRWGIIASRVI